jgi:hypothetical protein
VLGHVDRLWVSPQTIAPDHLGAAASPEQQYGGSPRPEKVRTAVRNDLTNGDARKAFWSDRPGFQAPLRPICPSVISRNLATQAGRKERLLKKAAVYRDSALCWSCLLIWPIASTEASK